MAEIFSENPATLLIIDDDPLTTELVIGVFPAPTNVLTALNGENGLAIATNQQPDIIILNHVVQDADGHELCSLLKSMPETSHIPVIFLGDTKQIAVREEELKALRNGAIDFVLKPLESGILEARINNQLVQKMNLDHLKAISAFDALTEVPNRRRFDEYLTQEWKRAARNKYPISILMIDIDHFKSYNDTYGHQKGDECLKTVANETKMHLRRPSDMLARYGGEEFSVILPDTPSYSAFLVANRIRDGIENLNIEHSGTTSIGHLTISIGVATLIPDESLSISNLIEIADINLYRSKDEGRNRVTG